MEKQEKMKLLLKLQRLQRKYCDRIAINISIQQKDVFITPKDELSITCILVHVILFNCTNIIDSKLFYFYLNIDSNKDTDIVYANLLNYIGFLNNLIKSRKEIISLQENK